MDTGSDSGHACARAHTRSWEKCAPRALPRNNLRREIHDNRDHPREFRMHVSPRSHGVCPQAPLFRRSSSVPFVPFQPACVRAHFSVSTDVSIISVISTLLPYYFLPGLRSRVDCVREENSTFREGNEWRKNPCVHLRSILKKVLKMRGMKARIG